jgi:hypothetical protein
VSRVGVLGACILILGLAACDANISRAEELVRNVQKDPDSAEFRNVRECPTGFYVTGEVNGKNSYGAYVGYRTFYANSAEAHIVEEDESPDITNEYVKMCNDQAYKDARMAIIGNQAAMNAILTNTDEGKAAAPAH